MMVNGKEAKMNIQIVRGALIFGAVLAVTVSPSRCLAQSNDVTVSAQKSASKNVGSKKHRYWRHRGGKHPHFGSRRIRT
jgi:hypothetical protein